MEKYALITPHNTAPLASHKGSSEDRPYASIPGVTVGSLFIRLLGLVVLIFFGLLGHKFRQISTPDEVLYVILEVHALCRVMPIQVVESTIFSLVFLSWVTISEGFLKSLALSPTSKI